MRRTLPLFLIAVSCAFSQKSPAPSPGLVEVTPDTVIATINGRKFTVADFERLLPVLQVNLQKLAASQPKTALTEYAFAELMAKEAEKLELGKDQKVQDKLAEARRQVLLQALVERKTQDLQVPDEDVRKFYETNMEALREAQVRMIFVSRGNFTQNLQTGNTTAADAAELKKKAEKAAKLAREGKDFAELAKEYSDDKETSAKGGALDLKIRTGVAGLARPMTDPILKASKGDIVGPLEHETGWYVFRVETVGVPELDAVRPDIEKQLKTARLQTWYQEMRGKASVQLDNDAFWQTFIATNKQEGAAAQGGAK